MSIPTSIPAIGHPLAGHPSTGNPADRRTTPGLALAALGIVYGDLGTSPLYTAQTIVAAAGGHVTPADALGILSLLFWALLITVSLKYCVFVMRADNHGEGGILALMALIGLNRTQGRGFLVACGLFGAALIYGDGVITPAISVLSALEGVNVVTDVLKPYVLPAAVVVLLGLFAAQVFGTAKIGRVFGPIMFLWFVTIALIGLAGVIGHPGVIVAVNPAYGIGFLAQHGLGSFAVLGGVFLAITGGEALYADMGHIGRNPIRTAWFFMVLPALLLSYAGQIGYMLDQPPGADLNGNPFFLAAPGWSVVPLVILATLATIIASQAIITGSFSLTRQAMQLGWFPGLHIRQTSDEEYGQIYVPVVNWTMMVFTILLAVTFGSSDKLAGAYGTAVSTTMLLTTLLLYTAAREIWKWPRAVALTLAGGFLIVDVAFFSANLLKIAEGGWVPLVFGAALFTVMSTWRSGIEAIRTRMGDLTQTPEQFLSRLKTNPVPRVKGTAVFLSRNTKPVTALMVQHVAQLLAAPEKLVSLTVNFEEVPRIVGEERVRVETIFEDFWNVEVRFGFLEVPSLREAMRAAHEHGCKIDLDDAVYFSARDEIVRSRDAPLMAGWRRVLFGFLYRNSIHLVDRFDLPPRNFVQIGRLIAI